MKTADEWMARVRQQIRTCREAAPLPRRDELALPDEWRCRIVGGAFLGWLRETGPQFLRERAVMSKLLKIEPEPSIVFTSDIPGLIAAQEIVGEDHERVAFLLDGDYAPLREADPDYRWHVHFWSFFQPKVDPAIEREAGAKYPLPKGCAYWQHSEGTMWAANAGRGVNHLWQWDGSEPTLLEEAFSHWVS
jgi:hypothetical protein